MGALEILFIIIIYYYPSRINVLPTFPSPMTVTHALFLPWAVWHVQLKTSFSRAILFSVAYDYLLVHIRVSIDAMEKDNIAQKSLSLHYF